ncbi:hypothetical protein J2S69_000148 [Glycomyces lechevalierae]|nr:hypothetical protein [Glycomyces lechevalierae]
MWHWLSDALVAHPETAIFPALGLGFLVGKLTIKGIALGPVAGANTTTASIGAVTDTAESQVPSATRSPAPSATSCSRSGARSSWPSSPDPIPKETAHDRTAHPTR